MTDDNDNMDASRAECKPLVLVPAQAEITIEIDDDGNLILRQEDALGNRPDTIIIARDNLASFVSDLIDCALPQASFPPRFDSNSQSEPNDPKRRPPDPTAAERQRRHRERKRGNGDTTGEPCQSLREAAE